MIRVLLADDHEIVRQGVRAVLERQDCQVVGEADNGRQALKLVQEFQPDVAVLDFSMPFLNGIDVARELPRISPRTKPLLLTMFTEDQYMLRALEAGFRGIVSKTQASSELVQAIRDVQQGGLYLSPRIASRVLEAYRKDSPCLSDPLTPRERQVLQLVAEGNSTKEIARLLEVSYKTADTHRMRLMLKLDLHDTAGLVRYAIAEGLLL